MSWKCFNTPSQNSGRKKTKKTTGKNLVIIASIPVVHRRVSDAVPYQRGLGLRKIDEKTKNLRSTLLRIFGSWNVEEKLEKITEGSKYCGYFSDLRGPWPPWKYREDFEISRTCKIHSKSSRTQLIFSPILPNGNYETNEPRKRDFGTCRRLGCCGAPERILADWRDDKFC